MNSNRGSSISIDIEKLVEQMPREQVVGMLKDAAKNWLAHDGLWFLAVEADSDMETAIGCDRTAWAGFSALEAKRIMNRHEIEPGGGLQALASALSFRLYSWLNRQTLEWQDDRLVLRVNSCRVQHARTRDDRPPFPCKSVGIVEYSVFARTIDHRIRTRCLGCPPDPHTPDYWCAWEFTVDSDTKGEAS